MRRGDFLKNTVSYLRALSVPVLYLLAMAGLITPASAEIRTLSIYNTHTKNTVTITFKKDGEYLPDGLKQINHVMRDWRRDEPTEMDPELIDLIWQLHRELGSQKPVHLISGYRSRKTNESLRRKGGGQARNSRHILGKAADIHFPDVSVKRLRNSALVHEVGGVGYYPKSALPFVHVDTGHVRSWPRLPRQELAALFPDGKTQHRPRDGKPITIADARAAIKRLRDKGLPAPHEQRSTVVADAGGFASAQRRSLENLIEASGKTQGSTSQQTRPAVITAGAGLSSLPWLARLGGITGSLPEENARIQLASVDAALALPQRPLHDKKTPSFQQAAIEDAPDYDPEHPEELSYRPFPLMPLMGEKPISQDTVIAALEQPAHEKTDYLMMKPERGLALQMKPFAGTLNIASSWHFSDPAARNLALPRKIQQQQPAPSHALTGRVMTASTPAPSSYGSYGVPVSAGVSGGSGFGFSSGLQ